MKLSGFSVSNNQSAESLSVRSKQINSENENPAKTIDLKTGQTLSGKVLSSSNGQISLSVNGTVINGNASSDVNFREGQELTFTVKQGENGQIIFSMLYENTANSQNVLQAIQASGLPQNPETILMVTKMMQEGLSIAKNEINSMFQKLQTYGLEKASSIMGLTKLGIAVNEENILQFENYRNLSHALSKGVEDILSQIPKVFDELLLNKEGAEALELGKNILSIFLEQNTVNTEEKGENSTFVPTDNSHFLEKEQELITLSNNDIVAEEENSQVKADLQNEIPGERILQPEADEVFFLNPKEAESLRQVLSELQINLPDFLNQASPKELLTTIYRELNMENSEQDFSKLFRNKAFQKLLTDVIETQWLTKPEAVGKEGSVRELYLKLFEQSGNLSKALQAVDTQQHTSLSQAVQNMRSNLDFMNQLNQFATYVQLPLKLDEQYGNGDLYVFTDKKSLAQRKGNVTALLHLSMEHVKEMDVFVSMTEQQVKLKFYLAEDELIDFFEENVKLLEERLAARGYSMRASVLSREAMKEEGVEGGLMNQLLKIRSDKKVNSMQGFDVKA